MIYTWRIQLIFDNIYIWRKYIFSPKSKTLRLKLLRTELLNSKAKTKYIKVSSIKKKFHSL